MKACDLRESPKARDWILPPRSTLPKHLPLTTTNYPLVVFVSFYPMRFPRLQQLVDNCARILNLLEESSDHLQIMILTCHPKRYRSLDTAEFFEIK